MKKIGLHERILNAMRIGGPHRYSDQDIARMCGVTLKTAQHSLRSLYLKGLVFHEFGGRFFWRRCHAPHEPLYESAEHWMRDDPSVDFRADDAFNELTMRAFPDVEPRAPDWTIESEE